MDSVYPSATAYASAVIPPHTTPVKRRGGRPRKEDVIQHDDELSIEARIKRDKRRVDNLAAAARYRQKKDEAIKLLQSQLNTQQMHMHEKYAKLVSFGEQLDELHECRVVLSDKMESLRSEWDNEMRAFVVPVEKNTRARAVLVMPRVQSNGNRQSADGLNAYPLSFNARQPTPPMIDGIARMMPRPFLDIKPCDVPLRLPLIRSTSPLNTPLPPDDSVLSFLRLNQSNPYNQSQASNKVSVSSRAIKKATRKGRPRLDESYAGQVLTASIESADMVAHAPHIQGHSTNNGVYHGLPTCH